jgi:hypothetical protein
VQIPSMRRCVQRNCRHIVASARLVFDCLCAIRMRVLLVRSPSITVFYFLCFEIRLRRACYAAPSVRHPGRHAPPCAPRLRVSSASRFWVAALCHAVRAILSLFFPAISSSVLLSALLPRSQPRPPPYVAEFHKCVFEHESAASLLHEHATGWHAGGVAGLVAGGPS